MNIAYCPLCNSKVYIFHYSERRDGREEKAVLFNVEPELVLIQETGEVTHANVPHRCKSSPNQKRLLVD